MSRTYTFEVSISIQWKFTFDLKIKNDRETPNIQSIELDSGLIEKVSHLPFLPGASQTDIEKLP